MNDVMMWRSQKIWTGGVVVVVLYNRNCVLHVYAASTDLCGRICGSVAPLILLDSVFVFTCKLRLK